MKISKILSYHIMKLSNNDWYYSSTPLLHFVDYYYVY